MHPEAIRWHTRERRAIRRQRYIALINGQVMLPVQVNDGAPQVLDAINHVLEQLGLRPESRRRFLQVAAHDRFDCRECCSHIVPSKAVSARASREPPHDAPYTLAPLEGSIPG